MHSSVADILDVRVFVSIPRINDCFLVLYTLYSFHNYTVFLLYAILSLEPEDYCSRN